MSQAPPIPPPPGYPPPQYGYGYPPEKRSNGLALASLILGILGCIPVITSLLAVFFGLAGISKSKDPRVGGRGMAIAGLILGILGLIGWGAGGYGFYFLYGKAKPFLITTTSFVQDVQAGNIQAAKARCTTDVTDAQLANLKDAFSSAGNFQNLSSYNWSFETQNGITSYHLTGTAIFTKGNKDFSITFVRNGDDVKIKEFTLK